jgi:hypothetical protein
MHMHAYWRGSLSLPLEPAWSDFFLSRPLCLSLPDPPPREPLTGLELLPFSFPFPESDFLPGFVDDFPMAAEGWWLVWRVWCSRGVFMGVPRFCA